MPRRTALVCATLLAAAALPAPHGSRPAQSQPPANSLTLFAWERGMGFQSPLRQDMRMYLRFYEWNMFEARQPGQHTRGNDRLPRSVSADHTQAEAGTDDLLLTVRAGAESADLILAITNRTDYEWPALAAIIPCFNPGPADSRNRELANTNTYFWGPPGLERLEKREIHFAQAHEAELRRISPNGQFVFSGKWPTAPSGALGGIMIRESSDGKWVTGVAWEDFLSAQAHNPWECMHLAVRVGPLKPGARKIIRGKVYLFQGKKEDCFQRYRADFPRASSALRDGGRGEM
jgi:hypothetical protein